jgi:hypothetical protein
MQKRDSLSKALTIAGTILVWLPVLAPVFFAAAALIGRGVLRFDYLMPAELFLAVLLGGGLLIWAAVRAHARRALIGAGLGVAAGMLIGGQALAVATGLASGETEPVGWPWAMVVASLVAYSLAVVAVGVGGVLLLRDLFRGPRLPRGTA